MLDASAVKLSAKNVGSHVVLVEREFGTPIFSVDMRITPKDARDLALALLEAANRAEYPILSMFVQP